MSQCFSLSLSAIKAGFVTPQVRIRLLKSPLSIINHLETGLDEENACRRSWTNRVATNFGAKVNFGAKAKLGLPCFDPAVCLR